MMRGLAILALLTAALAAHASDGVIEINAAKVAAGDGTAGLYSVSIRRYVPLALRLLECPAVVTMPGREKQIALLLAEDRETREIADRLGLTINTVISNIRSLYGRLGIGGRGELIARLLDDGN